MPADLSGTVRAAQDGDEEAFRLLYRSLQPGLLRYLTALVDADAEDVASEAWLRVTRDLRSFDGEPGFRAWVVPPRAPRPRHGTRGDCGSRFSPGRTSCAAEPRGRKPCGRESTKPTAMLECGAGSTSFLPLVGDTGFEALQASGGGASTALNVAYHLTYSRQPSTTPVSYFPAF